MREIKFKISIILLLVSVVGIAALIGIAQSENTNNKADNFDDNLNLVRVFRLVNSLNKEAEKQETKGFTKRAEMLRNYFQKKTGISNEAKLKLNQLATNFQKESEKVNAEIKEVRKNQANKPNDEAVASELVKLRESRIKLFDSSRKSLNDEFAKEDFERVLKFLREEILERIKNNSKARAKKNPIKKENQEFFENISLNTTFEAAMDSFMLGYSSVEYDGENKEVWSSSITEGNCEYRDEDGGLENNCSSASVHSVLSDPDGTGIALEDVSLSGSYAESYLYSTPVVSGQFCIDAEHQIEDQVYFVLYSQSSDCVNVALPTVKIMWNGNEITNTTQEAIVGQKIDLSMTFTGQGTPTNQQWTIGGEKVKNYVVICPSAPTCQTGTEGKPYDLLTADLNQNSINFYWWKGEDNLQVNFSAIIDGLQYQANASFNVKQPTVTSIDVSTGGVNPRPANAPVELSYGSPNSIPGVKFVPHITDNGIAGNIQWVQTMYSLRRFKWNDNQTPCGYSDWQRREGEGLDSTYPYPFLDVSEFSMADSPGINLTTSIQKVVATDTAKSWLMFKPQGDNSIWIPLKVISWSWNGEAEKIEGIWQKTIGTRTTPTVEDPVAFPKWTQNIHFLTFQCEEN